MADAFKESNTVTFRQNVVFYTGFSIIADQAFNIGSVSTISSFLNTYNQLRPYGGISGYLRSGEGGVANTVYTTGDQTIEGVKTFSNDIIVNGSGFIKAIIGGSGNTIVRNNTGYNFIGGGTNNSIDGSGTHVGALAGGCAILGGNNNTIGKKSASAFILGYGNNVGTGTAPTQNVTVIGGVNNVQSTNAFCIGSNNVITSDSTVSIGHYITNSSIGATILADGNNSTKTPAATSSCSFYFQNGVHILGPGANLTVQSTGTFVSGLVAPSRPPASSSAPGVAGFITWDSGYFYVCTGTNLWGRTVLSNW